MHIPVPQPEVPPEPAVIRPNEGIPLQVGPTLHPTSHEGMSPPQAAAGSIHAVLGRCIESRAVTSPLTAMLDRHAAGRLDSHALSSRCSAAVAHALLRGCRCRSTGTSWESVCGWSTRATRGEALPFVDLPLPFPCLFTAFSLPQWILSLPFAAFPPRRSRGFPLPSVA